MTAGREVFKTAPETTSSRSPFQIRGTETLKTCNERQWDDRRTDRQTDITAAAAAAATCLVTNLLRLSTSVFSSSITFWLGVSSFVASSTCASLITCKDIHYTQLHSTDVSCWSSKPCRVTCVKISKQVSREIFTVEQPESTQGVQTVLVYSAHFTALQVC